MAIIIRPVRGQVTQQKFQPSRSMLRLAQATRQDYSGVGKVITNSLQVIQQHQEKLENERINNKVANSEVMFMAESEKALQKLKEKNTVFTLEETENQLIQFGNKMDGMFKELFKDDPKAAAKGKFYSEKAKLDFMTQQNKLRNNQILAETIDRATQTKNNEIKNMKNKVKSQDISDPSIFTLLDSIVGENSRFSADNNSAISAGKNPNIVEQDKQEVLDEFYNSSILVERPDGSIDYQASMDKLKKNNIGGKKIERKQYERLEDEININLLQEIQFKQRSEELYNEEIFNKINKKDLDNISVTELKKIRDEVKGTQAKNQIDAEIANKISRLQDVEDEPDFDKQRDIEILIDTTSIVKDTDTPFAVKGEEEEKSLSERYRDREIKRSFYLEQKSIIQQFAGQEEKAFQAAYKSFFASVVEQIKGGTYAVGEAANVRLYQSEQDLKRIARDKLNTINPKTGTNYTLEDVFINTESDVFLQKFAEPFILEPDEVLKEAVQGLEGGQQISVPGETQIQEGESTTDFIIRRLNGN